MRAGVEGLLHRGSWKKVAGAVGTCLGDVESGGAGEAALSVARAVQRARRLLPAEERTVPAGVDSRSAEGFGEQDEG